MVSPWANGSIGREEWATRSQLQLSEPVRFGDLRFEPWMVKESTDIWNRIPMKENYMAFQPMKYIQDIKVTYTSDISVETRKFWDFAASELEGCQGFWE